MKKMDDLFRAGQGNFFDTIKKGLYDLKPKIFETLNFDNDQIYSEPLLYGFFCHAKTEFSLDQILFGYYPKQNRPIDFLIRSNKKGCIYLPNFGYLKTVGYTGCTFNLKYNATTARLFLREGTKEIKFEYQSIRYMKGAFQIELTDYIDYYSIPFFLDWEGTIQSEMTALIDNNTIDLDYFQPIIEAAFSILEDHAPVDFEKFQISIKRIVLFHDPTVRNFASRQAHGTIYLNVNENSNVTFFLEELVHQCSHIVFNAVTFDTTDYFKVDSNKPLSQFISNGDNRLLYDAFHGIYTTSKIVEIFIQLLKSNQTFEPEIRQELIGRTAINKNRHNIGLELVNRDEIFTCDGREIFEFYYNQLDLNIKKNPEYFNYNLDSQQHVFSYAQFKKDNQIS